MPEDIVMVPLFTVLAMVDDGAAPRLMVVPLATVKAAVLFSTIVPGKVPS